MKKVYAVRHQAAGIYTEHLFAAPPTVEQMEPIIALLEARFGKEHPTKGHEWWCKIVEVPLLEAELPEVELPGSRTRDNVGAVAVFGIHATGTVKNPGT